MILRWMSDTKLNITRRVRTIAFLKLAVFDVIFNTLRKMHVIPSLIE
jgi:hypothetical protein